MPQAVDLTVIAPMYNEEDSVADTVRRIHDTLVYFPGTWELLIVDDGSTDSSRARAEAESAKDPRVVVLGYKRHAGRGRALRTGFAAARGRYIVTVDFDLSYEPSHILRVHDALSREGGPDLVLVSAYMPGGTCEGVPPARLLPSKLGNWLLRYAWPQLLYTSTCIVRGYRREALQQLALTKDDKEIHLEILSQAFEHGLAIEEIPGHLRPRTRGKSKMRLGPTLSSHLVFLARRRPDLCAAAVSAVIIILGLLIWLAR